MVKCPKAVMLDLDGVVWDHKDISSLIPPFKVVKDGVISDRAGVEVRLREGVKEFLSWAREQGLIVVTVSWNDPEVATEAIKSFGLQEYFMRNYIEPHPHKGVLIMRAVKELGLEPEEVVYVDDRDIHLREVRELVGNVTFIKFGKGVKDFNELIKVLREMLRTCRD